VIVSVPPDPSIARPINLAEAVADSVEVAMSSPESEEEESRTDEI
jgi:hypothetical protein